MNAADMLLIVAPPLTSTGGSADPIVRARGTYWRARASELAPSMRSTEGALRCRAGTSGIAPVGVRSFSVSCESGRKIGSDPAVVNRGVVCPVRPAAQTV